MPLYWTIDHAAKRVRATLQTTTTEQEMYNFLGDVIGEGAMPYAKIFDGSGAVQWLSPSRVSPIAATTHLYSRMDLGPVGPLAIIIAGPHGNERAKEYVLLSDAKRLVRIFASLEDAEAWLASL